MTERRNVSATAEQWSVIDGLAAEDAAGRKGKADRSRTIVDLAIAERARRDAAKTSHGSGATSPRRAPGGRL